VNLSHDLTLRPCCAFLQSSKSRRSEASLLSSAARSRPQTQSTPGERACHQRDPYDAGLVRRSIVPRSNSLKRGVDHDLT